uniref:Peptidase_M28 domain-containing protein n=1 Tax=Haemonchus contortus TaxID=6289 RepID=A0A7I4YAK1_HAECO
EEFGVNLLSIQRGPHYNTPKDNLVIVAANYDTEKDVPGVDDNGSGVAAVLETARTLATFDKVYGRLNTIIYAFFDMKHQDFAGSHAFVEEVLLPYLTHTNTTVAGVLILDGLLHFDAFPTSQGVPKGFEEMFPTAARELHEHQHMGDYIQVTGRERKDDDALQIFFDAFYQSTARLTQDWTFQPWLLLLRLPMHTLTSVDDVQRMHSYLFADHSSFYFHSNPNLNLPTIHISDTLKFRGVRQYCPYCDSLFMLTDPNMRFLTVVVEAVIRTVIFLSESEARTVVDDLLQFQRPNKFGL